MDEYETQKLKINLAMKVQLDVCMFLHISTYLKQIKRMKKNRATEDKQNEDRQEIIKLKKKSFLRKSSYIPENNKMLIHLRRFVEQLNRQTDIYVCLGMYRCKYIHV